MAFAFRSVSLMAAFAVVTVLTGCTQATTSNTETSTTTTKLVSKVPGNCAIDDQKRTANSLAIRGWAVGNPSEAPQAIILKVKSGDKVQEYTTQFFDRPDIAKAYKAPALLRTGFTASIPATQIPAGTDFSIVVEGSKEMYQCKNNFAAK
jgi:hypothetical protein